jgi:hypothetical protein
MFSICRSKEAGQIAVVTRSKTNINNLNNVRCEASRYFRSKKREYLKGEIN